MLPLLDTMDSGEIGTASSTNVRSVIPKHYVEMTVLCHLFTVNALILRFALDVTYV